MRRPRHPHALMMVPVVLLMTLVSSSCVRHPPYGKINHSQFMRMQSEIDDGPFYMVNLTQYRDQAVYPDGRETTLTGREANARYAPREFLAEVGAEVVVFGHVAETLTGDQVRWDRVAIVRYPSRQAFMGLLTNEEFQKRLVHKDAALNHSIIMVTHLGQRQTFVSPTPGAQLTVAVRGDSSPSTAGTRFVVEGVLIGDGRSFDHVELLAGRQPTEGEYVLLIETVSAPSLR